MDADQKLAEHVEWLNTEGGFQNSLLMDKVLEAAAGVSEDDRNRIMNDLQENKEKVRDPNAYVTKALRKAGGTGGPPKAMNKPRAAGNPYAALAPMSPMWTLPPQPPAPPMHGRSMMMGGSGGPDPAPLRKRIGWLNNLGGFEGALIFDKIMEAAQNHTAQFVLDRLKELETKKGEVREPTSWVCSALRKAAPTAGAPMMQPMMQPMQYFAAPVMAPSSGVDVTKIKKRIGWLNNIGGFENQILYDKVMAAAGGVDTTKILSVLKDVEEKKAEVKDVTAYVTTALRRAAQRNPAPMMSMQAPAPMMMRGNMGAIPQLVDGGADEFEAKLRKRVGWLNNQGGFNNTINWQKVRDACHSTSLSEAFNCFKDLETKKDTVKDPTAYVCNALRKAGGRMGPIAVRAAAPKGMAPGFGAARGPPGVKKTIAKEPRSIQNVPWMLQ